MRGKLVRFYNKKNHIWHKAIDKILKNKMDAETFLRHYPDYRLALVWKNGNGYSVITDAKGHHKHEKDEWHHNMYHLPNVSFSTEWTIPISPKMIGEESGPIFGFLTVLRNIEADAGYNKFQTVARDPHIFEQEFAKKLLGKEEDINTMHPGEVYIALDGDGIGAQVEQAVISNDLHKVREISEKIHAGQKLIKSFIQGLNGELVVWGGDDAGAIIKKKHIEKLETLRESYKQIVGATLTIGIGDSPKDGGRALVLGKLKGKNRIETWGEGSEKELEKLATTESESDKLKREGLIPDKEKKDGEE